MPVEFTYKKTKEGYLAPNIQTSNNPEDDRPIGKYGRMALTYLQETDPILFMELQMNGTLHEKMHKMDDMIKEKILNLQEQLLLENPVPTTEDILEKTRHLNQIHLQAEEIVLNEVLYQTQTN
ncbi:TnpV protein [Bacillus sp. FSL W8-1127]|uniref:TnpV protein n=1 Tax=Bacillus sp. FSL W8-1127 TaxID=2954710 RepID=UPI0030FC1F71